MSLTGPTRKGTPGEWTALEFSLKEAYNTFQQDGGEEGSIGKFQRALHFAMQIHRWTDAQDPIRGLLMLADALGFCGRVPEAKGWAQRVQQLVMHHSPQGEEDPLFKSAQETLDRCAAACGAEDPFLELVARGRELYLQDGREGEAVPVLQEALEVGKRRILWFGDLQVLLCMSTLADALRLSGQGRESEQVSWEVLRLMRQHAPDQAQCIEKVLGRMQEMGAEQVSSQEGFSSPFSRGMELYEERRYPEAKALLLDSLQFARQQPHHRMCRLVGVNMVVLGDCCGHLGGEENDAEAIQFLQEGISLVEDLIMTGEDPLLAEARAKLEILQHRVVWRPFQVLNEEVKSLLPVKDHAAEAIPVLRAALREARGLPHWQREIDVLMVMQHLSIALMETQEVVEAQQLKLEVLPLLRDAVGGDHEMTVQVRQEYKAWSDSVLEQHPKIKQLYEEGTEKYNAEEYALAFPLLTQLLEEDLPPSTALCEWHADTLAMVGDMLGRSEEDDEKALEFLFQSLPTLMSLHGMGSSFTKTIHHKITFVMVRLWENYPEKDSGQIPEDSVPLWGLAARASPLCQENRQPEALGMLRKIVVEAKKRIVGWEQCLVVLVFSHNLAEALRHCGELEESLSSLESLQPLADQHLGEKHELTIKINRSLVSVEMQMMQRL